MNTMRTAIQQKILLG